MDTLYLVLSYVLAGVYLALPVAVGAVAWWRGALAGFALTMAAGLVIGVGLTLVYARAIGGPPGVGQAVLAGYLGGSFLLLLKGIDLGVYRLMRGREPGRRRAAAATFGRVLVLLVVGLPAVMAVLMVYRPKVVPDVTPTSELNLPFQTVTFPAADGSHVAAWWVPSPGAGETVLLLHGLGGGKADLLPLAGTLRAAGFNVLLPDLRAHGGSGGQLTSFGRLERHDVAGAVAWLRAAKPEASVRVHGVGTSMGAAALAATGGDVGIDRVVLIGSYDDLGALGEAVVNRLFLWPIEIVARHVALPVAAAHVGADLPGFRPADGLPGFYPRPVLVVHAEDDEMIPFRFGAGLYRAASEPKRQLYPAAGGHNGVRDDPAVIEEIVRFLSLDVPPALARVDKRP